MAKAVLNRNELKELIKESIRKHINEARLNGIEWEAEPEDWIVVNDRSYGDGFLFKIWGGEGYDYKLFMAYGNSWEDAMEHIYDYCVTNNMDDLFIDGSTYDNLIDGLKQDGYGEYEAEDMAMDMYHPLEDDNHYFRLENFQMEKVSPEMEKTILDANGEIINRKYKINNMRRKKISKRDLHNIIRESVRRQLRGSRLNSGLEDVRCEQTNSNYDETRPSNNSGNYPQYYCEFTYDGIDGFLYDSSCGDFGTRYELRYDGKKAYFGTMLNRAETTFDEFQYKDFIKAVEDYFDVKVPTITDHDDELNENGLRVLVNKILKEEMARMR